MSETRFYICEHCGNIVGMIHQSGVPIMCCGEPMKKMEIGMSDASEEKHVPVVQCTQNEVAVDVGSVAHPMQEEHHISWIYLQTDRGGQRKCLSTGEKPQVRFALRDEIPQAVYACCNLHGLWKTDIDVPSH